MTRCPKLLLAVVTCLLLSACSEEKDTSNEVVDPNLLTAPAAQKYAAQLLQEDQVIAAIRHLNKASEQFPDDIDLQRQFLDILSSENRYGQSEVVALRLQKLAASEELSKNLSAIEAYFDKVTKSDKAAVIYIDRHLDSGDYKTAARIAELADQKYPYNETLLQRWGEAQYKDGNIELAERIFRRALSVNPLNTVANAYISQIRDILARRQSQEAALWINIAKDKVGDFIVTFLALFAAFLVNSLVTPAKTHFKLTRARLLCERGEYDEFTDLMEGLLDQEDFAPLRSQFRFLLKTAGYDEAKLILQNFVNTQERLPSMLRILERENEKLQENS